jgi:hypothetical protein
METMSKEIAAVLRSTETMADQFAILVQRRREDSATAEIMTEGAGDR